MTGSFASCLLLSWTLFAVGLLIVLTQRSLLVLLLAFLVMFNACSLAWIAAAHFYGDWFGSSIAWLILAAITAQYLWGLALVITAVRRSGSVDITAQRYLKG